MLAGGAAWAECPKDVAQASDFVIIMVTDSAASEKVICGPHGILDRGRPGLILIDKSSIAPDMSRSIAVRALDKGVAMLDAPVTGAPRVASEGKLGIKDLSTALKLAEECGVALPAASICREILRAVRSQGKGDLDSCAVLTVLETMANTVVQRRG